MGLDFIHKAAPSFRKGLDRKRIELATPNLFTQQPGCAPRVYAANVRTGQRLTAGDKLGVRLDGQLLTAFRGLEPVATFNNPPTELLEALTESHGEACGVVKEVHDTADVAEITVC